MKKEITIPSIHRVGKDEYLVSVFKFGTPQVLANGVDYKEAVRIRQEYIHKKANQ